MPSAGVGGGGWVWQGEVREGMRGGTWGTGQSKNLREVLLLPQADFSSFSDISEYKWKM